MENNFKRPSIYEGLLFCIKENSKYFLLIFFLISQINFAFSQSDGKGTNQQKKAEQKKEQQAKASDKSQKKGREHHVSIQSKEVKKRMKRNRKRYDHVDSFDRRPNFIQRLFHRKKPSAK